MRRSDGAGQLTSKQLVDERAGFDRMVGAIQRVLGTT
jgi:hypothetical protein